VAGRLHAAEQVLADPDAGVRQRAIRETAEIVQAAYREVAGARYLTDVYGERVVIIQVSWIG
jgi:hypothetical protein